MMSQAKPSRADPGRSAVETGGIADPAGFWRRFFGFVIDWLLCFALPSLVSSLILLITGYSSRTNAVDVLWMLFLALSIVSYFTFFTMRGRSPGMRVAGIKILDQKTGQPPAFARAFTRALLLLFLIGSWFIVVLLGSDGRSGGLSNREALLLDIGYVVFLVSSFGHLWISWDRKSQTLQDKIAGVVVVRKSAVIEPVERPTRRIDPLEYRM
jgi:uncharacterized RDD family membrane protein YckC